jgi:broad specificity phosphatase PhoE
MAPRAFLVRHGETAWSKSGQHTSRTEIGLTGEGELQARWLAPNLASKRFSLVLVSPRQRARRTCELAGLGASAENEPDLSEWDYGDYEGLRSAEILKARPDWNLFRDGCPGGETPGQVCVRADRLVARVRSAQGDVALFSHGHFGRVFAARWVGFPVQEGQRLMLDTASLSILGYEHDNRSDPVISLLNSRPANG